MEVGGALGISTHWMGLEALSTTQLRATPETCQVGTPRALGRAARRHVRAAQRRALHGGRDDDHEPPAVGVSDRRS